MPRMYVFSGAIAASVALLISSSQAGFHAPGHGGDRPGWGGDSPFHHGRPPWAKPSTAPCSTSTASAPSSTFVVGQAIDTTSGRVSGHPAPNATEVSEYLGIPFAEPPVGDLRFAPPVRYYGSGELSGLSTNRICPQADLAGSGSGINASSVTSSNGFPFFLESLAGLGQERSEDCLTINVWTKPQTGSQKKPVMVWIYGGGFATGSSNASAYSGQYFADQEDVVFVNFNYRLGVFGFSGAPGLSQNVGLLDQRLAVEWVRDNAEAFGGDPSRIILFGESAGAASTDYYTYAWSEDPIIAGSIHESGQVDSFGNKAADQQAQRWYQLTTSLGCGNETTSTPEEVVSCMRDSSKVTTDALITNSTGSGALSLILAQFGPTVDDITVFSNYTERIVNGNFSKTPTLLGSNDNEAGIFILIFGLFGIQQSQAAWDVLTETVFTCPANAAAYARHLHNVPVWRYRYFPSFPNIQIPTSVGRAYHLSEVFPLFGTDVDVSGQPRTELEASIGGYLRSAWSAFAHDPAGALGGGEYNWPQYSPDLNDTLGLVELGKDNSTTPQFAARGLYDGAPCTPFYTGIVGF